MVSIPIGTGVSVMVRTSFPAGAETRGSAAASAAARSALTGGKAAVIDGVDSGRRDKPVGERDHIRRTGRRGAVQNFINGRAVVRGTGHGAGPGDGGPAVPVDADSVGGVGVRSHGGTSCMGDHFAGHWTTQSEPVT